MARHGTDDRLLAGSIEALKYITNLEFPNETVCPLCGHWFTGPEIKNIQRITTERILCPKCENDFLDRTNNETLESFLARVRHRTERYWPELWMAEPLQRPPESMLRRMRTYLRRFWFEQDAYARDWHIYRAREFYKETSLLRATLYLTEPIRKAQTTDELRLLYQRWNEHLNDTLDKPTIRDNFERALFELQKRSEFPSTCPLYCPSCIQKVKGPFFLSDKKGRTYCSHECSEVSDRLNKLKWYHKNKPTRRHK